MEGVLLSEVRCAQRARRKDGGRRSEAVNGPICTLIGPAWRCRVLSTTSGVSWSVPRAARWVLKFQWCAGSNQRPGCLWRE